MFNAEVINNTNRLYHEAQRLKEIPILSNVTAAIMDNYFQIKFDVRKIIEVAVRELKEEREVENRSMTGFD